MKGIKNQIQSRSMWIIVVMTVLGLSVIFGIIRLQSNDELVNKKVEESLIYETNVAAIRGNILANDRTSLLATSVPYYYVGIDPIQASPKLFDQSIDSLCFGLASIFGDKSWRSYKSEIVRKRNSGKRYLRLVSRRISHQEKEEIEKLPLFREGKHKGGGVFEVVPTRLHPFNSMAMRTIGGLDRETNTKGVFGIEFSYNNYLAGQNGKMLVKRLTGGVPLKIDSDENQEAIPGDDIITTIDVNFQDIVESALRKKVEETQAKYGTAIVMEIETGEIRAITNLSRRTRNNQTIYVEDLNHAVLASTDPGSTFKLATMMAVIEHGNLKLTDYAATCNGSLRHRGMNFTCDHEHGDITVGEVFEKSCNIGVYKLVEKVFGMRGIDEYLTYIHQYHLDEKVGFQLKGEKQPYVKNAKDKTFSASTLPWMSIGYETSIAPIQMLAFYNAVANDGQWVEPFLVKEIRNANEVIERYENRKIGKQIASKEIIKMAHEMMKGVVNKGTAMGIKEGFCSVAGKTGTAQKLNTATGYSKGKYFTSFIGFFPADNPKYTCLVVIDEPQGFGMYASKVCAPVFRDIANKIFAYDVKIHPAQYKKADAQLLASHQRAGLADDFTTIAEHLNLAIKPNRDGHIRAANIENNGVVWRKVDENEALPNVNGMTLKDALPILENKGYAVRINGIGKVKEYTLEGTVVNLYLN